MSAEVKEDDQKASAEKRKAETDNDKEKEEGPLGEDKDHQTASKRAKKVTRKGPEVLTTLKGLRFASVGPLLFKETLEESWFLSNDSLGEMIKEGGGFHGGAASLSAKTDIVILGNMSRLRSKKKDTWTGSKQQLQLEWLQEHGNIETLTFDEFLDRFHIRNLLTGASTISSFKPNPETKSGRRHAGQGTSCPVNDRYRGVLHMHVLSWVGTKDDRGRARPCLVRERYLPEEYCTAHVENQGKHAVSPPLHCAICAVSVEASAQCECGLGDPDCNGPLVCKSCAKGCCNCFVNQASHERLGEKSKILLQLLKGVI